MGQAVSLALHLDLLYLTRISDCLDLTCIANRFHFARIAHGHRSHRTCGATNISRRWSSSEDHYINDEAQDTNADNNNECPSNPDYNTDELVGLRVNSRCRHTRVDFR